jgi:hypothetical protein
MPEGNPRLTYSFYVGQTLAKRSRRGLGVAELAAKSELEATEGDLEGWQDILRTAIRFAGNCHDAYLKARPSVRRRFNDAVLEAVYIKERRIGRVEFSEVFTPLFSRPSSNKRLKVEVRGIEPLSPGDRSGLLRAQPVVNLASRLPPAEDLSASPGAVSAGGPRAEPSP